jgi:hypothetical protein
MGVAVFALGMKIVSLINSGDGAIEIGGEGHLHYIWKLTVLV